MLYFLGYVSSETKQFIIERAPWYATDEFMSLYARAMFYFDPGDELERYESEFIDLLKLGAFPNIVVHFNDGRCLVIMQMLLMCRPICIPRLRQASPLGALKKDIMRLLFGYLL